MSVTGNLERLQTITAGWIADGNNQTGCYNTLYPGFVHVSTKYAVGVLAQPVSIYDGQQYHLELSLYHDHVTGDWWFAFKVEGLALSASMVVFWGGEVYSSVKEKSPKMGSGHFPEEGFKKAAYVNGIKVIDHTSKTVSIPTQSSLKTFASNPNSYNVLNNLGFGDYWSIAIFFGGPGGCTF